MNNKSANYQIYRDSCAIESKTPVYALAQGIGDTELFIRLDAIPPSEVKTMKAMLTKGNFERIVVGSDELNEGVVKDRPNTSTLQPSLSRDSFYNSSTTSFGTKQGFSGSRAAFYSAFASTMKSSVSPPKKAFLLEKNKARITTDLDALVELVKVKQLKFYGIRFGKTMRQSLANCIKASKSLEELSIVWCRLVTKDLNVIYKPLMTAFNLKILDLSGNRFDDNAGELLVKIFSSHGQYRDEIVWSNSIRNEIPEKDPKEIGLREIDLSENALGNKSARELAHFVQYDGWVKTLNLKGNKIGEEGMHDLIQALLTNKTIFDLELRENPGYTPQVADQLHERLNDNVQGFRRSVQTILTSASRSDFFTQSKISHTRASSAKGESRGGFPSNKMIGKTQSQTPQMKKLSHIPSELLLRTQTTGRTNDTSGIFKMSRDIHVDGATSYPAHSPGGGSRGKLEKKSASKGKTKKPEIEHTEKRPQLRPRSQPKPKIKGKMGLTMEELEDRLLDAESIIAQLQLENHRLKMSLNLLSASQKFENDLDEKYEDHDVYNEDPQMRFGNTKQFTQHQQPPPQNYYEAGNLPPISEEPYASNKHSPGKQLQENEAQQGQMLGKIEFLMSEVAKLMDNLESQETKSHSRQPSGHTNPSSSQKNLPIYQSPNSGPKITSNAYNHQYYEQLRSADMRHDNYPANSILQKRKGP